MKVQKALGLSSTMTGFNKRKSLRNQARTASSIGYNDDYEATRNETSLMNKTLGFKPKK